ncbi:MAG: three-Cys-motif partner protein TcmP [Gemmatimonas sp.]
MADPYSDRAQTKAKHFILKHYLEALAFKVLTFSDITYIDGFSGPWETKTDNFSDSSFMIAIGVLRDAQAKIFQRDGRRRRINCFFSETSPDAFAQLQRAVTPLNKPEEGFEIRTFNGRFEDAITDIQAFVGTSFPLIFIDPTGWTGYPFEKIRKLFDRRKCEVLINFMYDFVNRFASSGDESTVASLDAILGGPGWQTRLDPQLPRGPAVEKLFRETLKTVGTFDFVVSTKIDKATAERPHFFITYGTKSREGLIAFRQIEYDALRAHARTRAEEKGRKREERSSITDLFAAHEAAVQESTIDEIVEEQKKKATAELLSHLSRRESLTFSSVVDLLLQAFMLRVTNVKDLCAELAKAGAIERTWGSGNRKPQDGDIIRLKIRR